MSQPSGESRPPLFKRLAQILGNEASDTPNAASDAPRPNFEIPAELRNHPRYQFLELLGAGGMGAVFKARHALMDRLVAVKVMHPNLLANPKAAERFAKEVRTAAQLSHPNIVAAYDAEQVGGLHFLAMEFVAGQNLADVAAQRGPLPITQACDFMRQAALGLQHAHERGMVHRDVKPHNLILTPRGQVKILDFGLARFLSERQSAPDQQAITSKSPSAPGLTQAGVIMGSPDYMAPEQAGDAHRADIRADIYSLGCTLYQLLTGTLPFPGGTTHEKIHAHRSQAPKSVHELRPDVPAALSALVARMMTKDPAARPQTPKDIVAALTPFCKKQTAPAPAPPPPRPRFRAVKVVMIPLALIMIGAATYFAVTAFSPPAVKPNDPAPPNNAGAQLEDPKKDEPDAPAPRAKPPVIVAETPAQTTPQWLAARTKQQIIKVAQDGSGDFKTIQQALDAVKEGQAIVIQDRGPYRERLDCRLPADVGLISHVGTRIEIPGYHKDIVLRGAFLDAPRGFRMAGLDWVGVPTAMPARMGNLVYLGVAGDVVIERCSLKGPEEMTCLNCNARDMPDPATRVLIQHNVFHQRFAVYNVVGDLTVQKNIALSSGEGFVCSSLMGRAVIRHNVLFAGDQPLGILQRIHPDKAREILIHNNVLSGARFGSIRIHDPNPHQPQLADKWHIANNLFAGRQSGGIYVPLNFRAGLAAGGAAHWEVGPNAYYAQPTALIGNDLWPLEPRDIVAPGAFRRVDPSHPDYLRVSSSASWANGGAGGALPSYFGALPPSPAAKDEFSQLLSKAPPLWTTPGEAQPTRLSVAEFLAKAKVRTVAQDGSGDFRSIQAALDALKADEAILIKDKGPYREAIDKSLPGGNALISLVGTRIEIDRYSPLTPNSRNYFGARFQVVAGGFLMHGIDWTVAAPLPKGSLGGVLVQCSAAFNLVVEKCSFASPDSFMSLACTGFRLRGNAPRLLIQDNRLNRLNVFGVEGYALIQRNWIKTPLVALSLGDIFGEVAVRHNILEAGSSPISFVNTPSIRTESMGQLDITNNVLLSNKAASIALVDSPFGKTRLLESIRIANNIFHAQEFSGVHITPAFRERLGKALAIGPNAYQAKPAPALNFEPWPMDPRDQTAATPFLSGRPEHADYLHIAADSPLAEADGAEDAAAYFGAFSPGPAPKEGDWLTRLRASAR